MIFLLLSRFPALFLINRFRIDHSVPFRGKKVLFWLHVITFLDGHLFQVTIWKFIYYGELMLFFLRQPAKLCLTVTKDESITRWFSPRNFPKELYCSVRIIQNLFDEIKFDTLCDKYFCMNKAAMWWLCSENHVWITRYREDFIAYKSTNYRLR